MSSGATAQCPLCYCDYPLDFLPTHAAECEGPETAIDEATQLAEALSLSQPKASLGARGVTPPPASQSMSTMYDSWGLPMVPKGTDAVATSPNIALLTEEISSCGIRVPDLRTAEGESAATAQHLRVRIPQEAVEAVQVPKGWLQAITTSTCGGARAVDDLTGFIPPNLRHCRCHGVDMALLEPPPQITLRGNATGSTRTTSSAGGPAGHTLPPGASSTTTTTPPSGRSFHCVHVGCGLLLSDWLRWQRWLADRVLAQGSTLMITLVDPVFFGTNREQGAQLVRTDDVFSADGPRKAGARVTCDSQISNRIVPWEAASALVEFCATVRHVGMLPASEGGAGLKSVDFSVMKSLDEFCKFFSRKSAPVMGISGEGVDAILIDGWDTRASLGNLHGATPRFSSKAHPMVVGRTQADLMVQLALSGALRPHGGFLSCGFNEGHHSSSYSLVIHCVFIGIVPDPENTDEGISIHHAVWLDADSGKVFLNRNTHPGTDVHSSRDSWPADGFGLSCTETCHDDFPLSPTPTRSEQILQTVSSALARCPATARVARLTWAAWAVNHERSCSLTLPATDGDDPYYSASQWECDEKKRKEKEQEEDIEQRARDGQKKERSRSPIQVQSKVDCISLDRLAEVLAAPQDALPTFLFVLRSLVPDTTTLTLAAGKCVLTSADEAATRKVLKEFLVHRPKSETFNGHRFDHPCLTELLWRRVAATTEATLQRVEELLKERESSPLSWEACVAAARGITPALALRGKESLLLVFQCQSCKVFVQSNARMYPDEIVWSFGSIEAPPCKCGGSIERALPTAASVEGARNRFQSSYLSAVLDGTLERSEDWGASLMDDKRKIWAPAWA